MDNAEILHSLKERARQDREQKVDDEPLFKYVVFSIGEQFYALSADVVREITIQDELYYVPFVPPYVRGYANRHGQPYTVMDVQMLFEQGPLESGTLLVLNVPGDQLALLISEVDEIIKVPASEIHSLASNDESSRYFTHSITVAEREVFALKVETLLERLERDIERA